MGICMRIRKLKNKNTKKSRKITQNGAAFSYWNLLLLFIVVIRTYYSLAFKTEISDEKYPET